MAQRMKPVVVIGLILGIGALMALGYFYLPKPPGETESFRGMLWGGSVQAQSGLDLLGEEGALKFYLKQGEPLEWKGVQVRKIIYGFHKDRFFNVMVYYQSPEDFLRLRDVFTREYGAFHPPDPSARKLFWSNETLTVLLSYDDAAQEGRVTYLYKPIQTEIEVGG